MTAAASSLTALKSQRPEWMPWLAVVEETLHDAGNREWDVAVPAIPSALPTATPVLAGATIAVEARAVRSLLRRLIAAASRGGTPQMATLGSLLEAQTDVLALFEASLSRDNGVIAQTAESGNADPAALEAMIALVAMPFLHACRRQWAPIMPAAWREGYCSLCAAWPAFAEVRGIERTRVFRCSRCGGAWHARPLRCAFCSTDDHNALVALVAEGPASSAQIDACRSCEGYLKVFSRLQGCAPDTVIVDDLASVHLDVAALAQGYARKSGLGRPLEITVIGC